MSTYWALVLRFRSASAALLSASRLRALDLGKLQLHVAQLLLQHADARIGRWRRRLFGGGGKSRRRQRDHAAPARRNEARISCMETPCKIIPPVFRTGRAY